ncbi:MAG: hypothetical protein ACC631_03185 [Halocynthiibacter sp.]
MPRYTNHPDTHLTRLCGRGQKRATETHRDPGLWLDAVERSGSGESSSSPVTKSDQAEEYLMMGLRLNEGIALDRFEALAGRPLSKDKIKAVSADGLLFSDSGNLIATPRGRLLLNSVLLALLAG